MGVAKALTSPRICADSSEPSLLADAISADVSFTGPVKLYTQMQRICQPMRKPVFGFCHHQVGLNPACSATETILNIEMLNTASLAYVFIITRITNTLNADQIAHLLEQPGLRL